MREVSTGEIYRHFKGNLYQVVAVARHADTDEEYVVYQALYGDMQVWVRPYSMFVNEVDHDKYPDVSQKYRFELLNTIVGGGALSGKSAVMNKREPEKEQKIEGKAEQQIERKNMQETEREITENNAHGNGRINVQKNIQENANAKVQENVQASIQEDVPEGVDKRLLAFLDAETCQDKINYLALIRSSVDDRLIDDIAAAMDIAVDDGPLDVRYYSLRNCLMTKAKYECGRR